MKGRTEMDDFKIKCEELSQLIAAVEQVLTENPPKEVWIDCGEDLMVGIDRLAGKWRLMVGLSRECAKPVSDSSITLRMKAAKHLSRLKVAIVETRKDMTADLTKAAADLRRQLEEM
jgi:hypothetical protein